MSETPCGRCGATHVEMYMTCTPSCVNKEACALRAQLRDLRARVIETLDTVDTPLRELRAAVAPPPATDALVWGASMPRAESSEIPDGAGFVSWTKETATDLFETIRILKGQLDKAKKVIAAADDVRDVYDTGKMELPWATFDTARADFDRA